MTGGLDGVDFFAEARLVFAVVFGVDFGLAFALGCVAVDVLSGSRFGATGSMRGGGSSTGFFASGLVGFSADLVEDADEVFFAGAF